MRLGKTLIAVRLCVEWQARRILIVAPLSVIGTWQRELAEEGLSGLVIDGKTPVGATFTVGGFLLVGYERLRLTPELASLPWDVVILDESTRIKNPKARITKLCIRGFRRARHRVILSGLPAPEGPLDYCTQFLFLNGEFCQASNYWQFRMKYFRQGWYDWRPYPKSIPVIREAVQRNAYVLSRTQAGIGSKKVYEVRNVPMNSEQLRLEKSIKQGFELGPDEQTVWSVVCANWLSRVAGGHGSKWKVVNPAKALEVKALLYGELSAESVLVFFRFNRELDLCWKTLGKPKWAARMTGETSPEDRSCIVRAFSSGEVRVILLQVKVGKFGLNLSRASTVIYYSNSYSMEDRHQSEDRIVHPAKTEPLLYIDLVSKGSIDEELLRSLREKRFSSRFFLQRTLSAYLERKGLSNVSVG
jgi:SNF2 family DNA or RNA helicase